MPALADALDVDGVAWLVERHALGAADVGTDYATWTADVLSEPPVVQSLALLSREEAVRAARRFLVAATLKDASIFLAVAAHHDDEDDSDDTSLLRLDDGTRIRYRLLRTRNKRGKQETENKPVLTRLAPVADVDPKPFERFHHWIQLDDAIAAHAAALDKVTCSVSCTQRV